ncbi:MAG: hypothetical protein ACE5JI_20930, partial [Acidobacteriota bacterium]
MVHEPDAQTVESQATPAELDTQPAHFVERFRLGKLVADLIQRFQFRREVTFGFLTGPQRLLRPLALGDVLGDACDAVELSEFVADREAARP